MNFEQFVASEWQNYWIKIGTLEMYVRKTPIRFRHKWGDIQLASMVNKNPGNGDLNRFLQKWEIHFQFYIENVLNPRLVEYFKKRQYRLVNKELCLPENNPCFLGPEPTMLRDLFDIVRDYHKEDTHE